MPSKHDDAEDRTLQDDRVALNADPGNGSELVDRMGAPLAQDGVTDTPAESVEMPLVIGGAILPSPAELDLERRVSSHDPMTAAGDRPIDD